MPLIPAAQPCPSPVASLSPDFFPNRMAAAGNRLYVAAGEAGLAVFDFQPPSTLSLTAMLDTPGLAVDVSVSGTLALIADGTAGLQVADVSDPAQPRLAGNLPLANAAAVALDGTHAYAISIGEGLIAADVSDPSHPIRTALLPWGGTATNGGVTLHVAGGHLFGTDLYTGLWIYDVADPAQPALLSNTPTYGLAWDLAVSGSRVFIAADFGIQIFDVSDSAAPSELGHFPLPGTAYGVVVRGDYAYVADYWAGLRVVNIAAAAFESGYTFTSANAFFIASGNRQVFVATNFRDSKTIDVLAIGGCGAQIIPAAAHKDGAGGTHWRTDLILFNPTSSGVQAELDFIQYVYGQPPFPTVSVTVPSGAEMRLDDVLGTSFGLSEVYGGIAVESEPSLMCSSRTYTDGGDAGTAGQSVPSFSSDDAVRAGEEVYVFPLARNAAYRSNLGVVNISNQQYWVDVKIFDHFGNLLGEDSYYILPWAAFQKSDIVGLFTPDDQEGAFAVVSAAFDLTPPDVPLFFAYGSVVDNRTGDPVFYPAQRFPYTVRASFLPVCARAQGAYGASWKTELAVLNFSMGLEVDLAYYSSQGSFTSPSYISSGSLALSQDVVSQYFPSIQGDARGTLLLTPRVGSGIAAAARVYNDTPAGTYGQSVPPEDPNELLQDGETGFLPGLLKTAAYRTNLGFSGVGADAAHIRLTLKDAAGGPLADKIFDVGPEGNFQMDDVFTALGVAGDIPDAYAVVEVLLNGPVYAYASVIDNRTGDGVFVLAQK